MKRTGYAVWTGLVVMCFAPCIFAQSSTSTEGKSSEIRSNSNDADAHDDSTAIRAPVTGGDDEPDAPQTVYSKTGATDHKESNPYNIGPNRGRINYGKKKGEKIIETDSSKPVTIKKTNFGADVSEPSGPFKQSLLDSTMDLHQHPLPSAQPKPSAVVEKRLRAKTEVAKPVTSEDVTAPQLNIGLGVAPGATVAPKVTGGASAEASPAPRP